MTTVLISYNQIKGFDSGWHADGKVYVCANDAGLDSAGDERRREAGAAMHNVSNAYYHGSVPTEQVERYIVYSGLNALRSAISMAKDLCEQAEGVPVVVAGCDCRWDEKVQLLRGTGIELIRSGCGGRVTMGNLAQKACEA